MIHLFQLKVLRPGGPGGVILLLTDGEETDRPFINDVLPSVINSGARVVSIAFGFVQANYFSVVITKHHFLC